MITVIITLLMALGLIDSPEAYNNLTDQQQIELQEIIIADVNEY